MKDFRQDGMLLKSKQGNSLCTLLFPIYFLLLVVVAPLHAQLVNPALSIKELREGNLIVRIPTYKAKIDTLTAMNERSTDPKNQKRIRKQLQETIEQRDTLFADYVTAFKNSFQFCPVAYYFDYDAKDLNLARYYNLEGEHIAVADLSEKPLFYLHFERTTDSKVDALIVYNRFLKKIPDPFPNDFARGGLNFLFVGLSDKKFPTWRVEKMNKRFFGFLEQVEALEKQ